MDVTQIINQVESPITDEEIEMLIKKYIECKCDMNEFYKSININVEETENPYVNDLYSRMFSIFTRGERFVDGNRNWDIVGSSRETLSVPREIEDRVPIYRIYINAQGQDKAKIVEDYITACEEDSYSYKLKYSIKDGRKDAVIILSYGEDLTRNIQLIERITEGMSLGEPAELLGRYKGKFGIGEEYIQAPIYSYTQTRLGLIPIAMQKYFLDHKEQFEQYLDENHKGFGDFLSDDYKERSEELLEEIEELSEDEKKVEELKKEQFAYQNNIELDFIGMYDSLCQYIPETMQNYIAEHSETAILEIIENYRLASEIFGISRDGVFSIRTEQMLEQAKQTPLQQRDAILAALEAEARGYDEAEKLKSKLEQRDGQNIGE